MGTILGASLKLVRDTKIYFMSLTTRFGLRPCFSRSCASLSGVSKIKRHDSWKARVHPAFLEIAKLWSDFQKSIPPSGASGAKRNAQQLRADVLRNRDELLKRYPELRPGSPSNHVRAASTRFPSDRDAALGFLEWLCWRRTGQSLTALLAEEKAGSLEAHDKVQRVRDDFWRAVHARQSVEPFKGNPDHCELLELGLNLGLKALTAEELADCLDEVCPCGESHDADALKKLRTRICERLDAAHVGNLRTIPRRQRFAIYGAHGLTAKSYNWEAKGIRHVEISRDGERPECLIYPNGDVIAADASRFYQPGGLDRLLEAFGVETPEQLFSMFFL